MQEIRHLQLLITNQRLEKMRIPAVSPSVKITDTVVSSLTSKGITFSKKTGSWRFIPLAPFLLSPLL
jgi:hypothetical protein